MIATLVLRICAVRISGHKHDHVTWHIIFITVLRPLILLKCVKFSDQGNTLSISEKRAHGLFLTRILNSWHIHNVPTAEEQKTKKWVALTETCNEWNSLREICPGILEVSEAHLSFIPLVWFCGTDRYRWRFCRAWSFFDFTGSSKEKKKWNCRIKFLGPRTLRDPEIQAEFASW